MTWMPLISEAVHEAALGDLPVDRISARLFAGEAAKHGGERPQVFVAEIKGDLRDGSAGEQARDGAENAGALPPFAEAHAQFALKAPGKGSAADMKVATPVFDRRVRQGLLEEALAEERQPWG